MRAWPAGAERHAHRRSSCWMPVAGSGIVGGSTISTSPAARTAASRSGTIWPSRVAGGGGGGGTRRPEVLVLGAGRRVRYRGRIDDQYEPGGKNRGKPIRHDLAEAVGELLSGESISVPSTPTFGCLIAMPRAAAAN